MEKPIRTGPLCGVRDAAFPVDVSCGAFTHPAAIRQLPMTPSTVLLSLRIHAPLSRAALDSMMRGSMQRTAVSYLVILFCGCATRHVLFDDFNYAKPADLAAHGWIIRTEVGFPGLPGAKWGSDSISLIDDPQRPGNRLLRLNSVTDGAVANTRQAQICHQRKYLEGTYAARVRFSDQPTSGPNGDQIVETFYMISPLKAPMDVDYSEMDFEYLPNGGWAHAGPTIFATTWETFSPEPNWRADNVSANRAGPLDGWHTLVVTVGRNTVRYFIDGELLAEHGDRFYPDSLMSINFNLWFVRDHLINVPDVRRYEEDIDWVFHRAGATLTPAEVEAEVAEMRRRSVRFTDNVPSPVPALSSLCNF
jgi:hypothetical protein